MAVAVVASLIAARSLFGSGSLVAPALLPAHDSIVDLWRTVVSDSGRPAQADAALGGACRLASAVMFAQPEWFTTLLLCGVVPLSLLAAYPLARRVINDRRVRLWVCGTYALLPVLLGGTNQGRLALSVVAIGLPLLVMAARALVLRRTRTAEAWRGGWCGSGTRRPRGVRAVHDHLCGAGRDTRCGRAASQPAQDRPNRHCARRSARRIAAVVADSHLSARTAVRRARLGAS